jgi:hypothetical protein
MTVQTGICILMSFVIIDLYQWYIKTSTKLNVADYLLAITFQFHKVHATANILINLKKI